MQTSNEQGKFKNTVKFTFAPPKNEILRYNFNKMHIWENSDELN